MTPKPLFLSKRSQIASFTAGLVLFFAFGGWTLELPSLPVSPANALKDHVRYLASDELTGRGIDTPGIKLARDYIAREFVKYGLVPGGDNGSYFQGFDVTTGVAVQQPTALALDHGAPLALNEDWTPLALSNSGKVEEEVVFAGYGITAKDYGYDDYAGIDVKGKIVIVLRYEPPPKDDKSPFQKPPRYSAHATLRAKANNARDHGAAAMILVDLNRREEAGQELISTRSGFSRNTNGVIAVQVQRQVLEKWLQARGVSLAELKEKIDRDEKPASMPLPGPKVSMSATLQPIRQRAENVVGILPEEARRLGLEVRESDSVGRSDQMSFYNKKIPSLHFFTGSHPDYHRPTDTWEKVNADGMVKVSDLVLATGERIANMRELLNFVSLPSRPPSNNPGETRSYGVYLGSIPDMDDSQEGVRLAGVSDGSPAALAGLREGDVIVEFAGSKVQNLEDLANLLGSKKPGDEVEIMVLRTGKPVTLKAILRARS